MENTIFRYLLAIRIWLVTVLAVLILLSSCATSGTAIKVEPAISQVRINDTVKVLIKVENIVNLIGVEIHLSFDTTVLEVIELNGGGFINADFIVQNAFDNASGTIDYAIAQINSAPANGNGTLLEIVFRAKASGDSPIRFLGTQAAPAGALFSDSNGMAIQASLIDGKVNVR
jgi:hypothetical protein